MLLYKECMQDGAEVQKFVEFDDLMFVNCWSVSGAKLKFNFQKTYLLMCRACGS